MGVRKDDDKKSEVNSQTSRFTEASDGWYFRTREGIEVGPYPDSFDAELCASLLVSKLAQLGSEADYQSHIRMFVADTVYGLLSQQFRETPVVDLHALNSSKRREQMLKRYRGAWNAIVHTVSRGIPAAVVTRKSL